MSYNITTSDGTVNITIPDGGFDNSTSLTLAGPNAVGYGQYLDQNLLSLLSNFASNAAPGGTNIQGQLYFNKSNQTLEVFTTQGYLPVSGITVGTLQPSFANPGNIWFNTSTNQLYLYDGTNWDLIGPIYTKAMGISGAIPLVVNDANTTGLTHNIVKLQFGGTIIAIFNSDIAFQPSPSITGFATINQGITLNSVLINSAINTNVTGNVTGSVTGNLTGSVTGNITGTTASFQTISGNLAGNVTGNLSATTVTSNTFFGNVTSTANVTANLMQANVGNFTVITNQQINTSNVISPFSTITNMYSSNVNATGGNLTGFTSVVSSQMVTPSLVATNIQGNVTANIGTVTAINQNITNSVIGTGLTSNFSSGNVQIFGGNLVVLSANATNANITGTVTTTNLIGNTATLTTGYIQNAYASSVNALSLKAPTIGNTGAILIGNISSSNAFQSNITGVGTITQGVWQASIVGSQYGGTGVNNGSYSITVQNASQVLNQNVAISSSPTLIGTNFSGNAQSLTSGTATRANIVSTGGFTIQQIGTKLYFQYGGTNIASLDSSGNFQVAGDVTAFQATGSL